MQQIHVWPEPTLETDDSITVSVTIEKPDRSRDRLWYRLPVQHRSLIPESCDPFAIGTLFVAMQTAVDLHIHGTVSPSLLQNLEEFQAAWACWRPGRYTPIRITADNEQETPENDHSLGDLLVFSGGVDSCFTAWRHATGNCGRLQRPVKAGLMVHGFDIPLQQQNTFEQAAKRSATMLESLGLQLIPMATNFRDLGQDWEDVHGAAIASCLMLLQRGFRAGLVASTEPYQALIPWGSNPITDPLMSSHAFRIIHDGAAFTRLAKIQHLANWPEAQQQLRVCWQGAHKDRNCGRCEKCIRTILGFRVAGLALPPCFEQDVTDQQISALKGLNPLQLSELEQILRAAEATSISDSWVKALSKTIQANRFRATWKPKLQALKAHLRSKIPS